MKKTDLMRAVDKIDAEIATHQQAIDSLQATKQMLADVVKEKGLKKAKKPATAVTKRAPRASRVPVAATESTGVDTGSLL